MDPLDRRDELAAQAIDAFHGGNLNREANPMLRESPGELDADTFAFLAEHSVVLLPDTIYDDDGKPITLHRTDAIEFRKLLRENGVDASLAPSGEGLISEEALDLHLAAILVSAQHILTSPDTVKFILQAAWDYVKGTLSKASVFSDKCKLDISVVHADRSKIKVEYEGPASGLADVEAAIKAAAKKQP